VYGPDSPFQKVTRLDDNTLLGPGVADAKGGLVVLLFALMALERYLLVHTQAELGWDVIINADEEVGSMGSAPIFKEYAVRVQWGLLFEPSLPDGTLISARKGSGNFAIVVQGKSAHAGRDFDEGRNAIVAAARMATALHDLNGRFPAATINVGRIEGGGPTNVVPELGVVRWNVRHEAALDEAELLARFEQIVAAANQQEGIHAKLHGGFTAPPKPLTPGIRSLLDAVAASGRELGLSLAWQASGGVCDGNRLAAYGVPNVDTLGVRGGNIHSDREYVLLDSLPERAKLTALLLMKMADGLLTKPNPPSAGTR
jgi:glutamate carboxypeptidase